MDQTKGEKKSGPHINHEEIKEEHLICQINSASLIRLLSLSVYILNKTGSDENKVKSL